MRFVSFLIVLTAAMMVLSQPVMAQANLHDAPGSYDGLLDIIRNSANQWSGQLRGYATNLFWSLVTISLVWNFGQLVLRQAEFSEIAAELFKFIVINGFFYTLMIFSVDIASAIINSFRQAGATAAGVGTGLRPGDLFGLGAELAKTLTYPTVNPALALQSAIAGLIILLCFAFIAAFMGITLIQAYVVINASVLLMGFGGSQWTRDYSMAMLRGAMAMGVKLFALTLIVGIVMVSAREWQRQYTEDDASTFTILGLAFVAAYMCKSIPDMMSELIGGISPGSGGIIGGMAAAGMAFGAGAMTAIASQMGSGGIVGGIGQQLGGVSDLMKGSGGPNGPQGGSGNGGAAFMSPNGGPGGSGASRSPYSGPGPRIGGGGTGAAPSTGQSPASQQPSSSTSSSQSNPSTRSGGGKAAAAAHTAAEIGTRVVGTAASVAIPGAEGSESLSVGPPPAPSNLESMPEPGLRETPANIIRPAAANPAGMPDIETMEGLQEALNNRGKPS